MEIEKRGNLLSAVSTAIIFIVLLILSFLIKFKPKENFNPIVIQLEPPVVTEKKKTTTTESQVSQVEKAAASESQKSEPKVAETSNSPKAEPKEAEKSTGPAVPETVKKPEVKKGEERERPAVEKRAEKSTESVEKPAVKSVEKVEKVEKKTEVKKAGGGKAVEKKEAVKEVPKKVVEEPKIKKSIEELMAEQNSTAKKKVEFDESLFAQDDSAEKVIEEEARPRISAQKSSMDGTSANSAGENTLDQKLSSSSSSRNPDSTSASSSTKEALSGIRNTTFSSTVSEGVKSRASIASSKTSGGELSIQMSDGSSRQLLYPKSPSIFISEENARLVDSTREVEIRFTVKADGSVPFGEIIIRPAALLPSAIQTEIKMQISEWKFSEEPLGRSGSASFGYTLEIR